MDAEPALRVVGVDAFYGTSHVLHATTLDVPRGDVTAIVGPNGVGKTTLINAIMGLVPIAAGRIEAGDMDLSRLPATARRRHGLALVPQGRRVFRSLTVDEHLTLVPSGASGRFDRDWVFEVFPRLAERRSSLARNLSGGEQSMLAIGRALTANPRIVLMDEPTEGLAPLLVEVVRDVVERVRGAGVTVLLVEQNLGFALSVADRVAIMHRGAVDRVRERDAITDVEALSELVLGTTE
ncbi:MAG: ABC transporter ATP-binding protein [Thermomicrobiales bacterium]|nr:ABC transporter ATP-binding protein [Thermomicrobiales bacterium]